MQKTRDGLIQSRAGPAGIETRVLQDIEICELSMRKAEEFARIVVVLRARPGS